VALDGATFQMSACARMFHPARQNDRRLRITAVNGEHERIGTIQLWGARDMLYCSSRQSRPKTAGHKKRESGGMLIPTMKLAALRLLTSVGMAVAAECIAKDYGHCTKPRHKASGQAHTDESRIEAFRDRQAQVY